MRCAWLLAPTLTMGVAAGVTSQQLPAFSESIVITASGDEEPADETAAAATVIDREEIASSGVVNVAELLRRVPGTTVARSGGDNGVTTLFVRGTNASHTLVLLDGVRLSSPFFGGYDWSLPLTAGVGRIEVVRGPYSALYGSDAVGGVVQLLSRRATGQSFEGFMEGGDQGWRRGEAVFSFADGGLDLLATGTWREGTGPLVNDDFSSSNALVTAGWSFATGRLGLVASTTSGSTGIPFSGPTLTPHRETSATERVLALPLRLAMGTASRLEVTVSRVERTLAYRDPDDPWGYTSSDTDADSTGARVAWHFPWRHHQLVAGGEWRRDRVVDRSVYGVNLAGERLTTSSLFLQDRVAVGRHLDILVGARWDRAEPWGSQLSPRATLSWKAAGVRTWLAWGRAFRAPSLGELYYPYSGNPALGAERANATEVGISIPAANGRASLQVVAFSNRIDDLVDFDYAAFRYANVARAAQDGLELSGSLATGSQSRLSASLSYLDARDGAGQALLRRPSWSGSVTIHGRLSSHLAGELTAAWVGTRKDLDPVSYGRVDQEGFVTTSGTLSWPLSSWLTLRVRGENLADRSYEEVRGYPAPSRRLMLGVAFAAR